jgi:hypothetical protein
MRAHDDELKTLNKVSEVKVEVHVIVVSSLGVVPKSTTKAINRMFKMKRRTKKQIIKFITLKDAVSSFEAIA